MRISTVVSLCALLAGCGSASAPSEYGTLKNALVNYPIDANVGTNLYDDTFAITTNGYDWTVAWIGDEVTHDFSGFVQVGGNISNVTTDGLFGADYVAQTDYNLVEFDAQTDYSNIQSFTFTSDTIPVRFYLYVDGIPAVYQVVYTSSGIESTTDEIPFDLTPSGLFRVATVGKSASAPVRLAPSFGKSSTGIRASIGTSSAGVSANVRHIEAPASRASSSQAADR